MPRRPELYRMAMLDLYCDSFPVVPSHLTLDLDESFDRGEQELRKFNAYYDDWGFLPIHIFDTSGRLVVSVLREAATPSGREILTLVKRVVSHLRERFPWVRIRLRGDSHYACPEVMSWCEAEAIEYIFGLAGTAPLAAQVQTLEGRTAARYAARRMAEPPKFKLRRYMDFRGGAKSWKCQRRIGSKPDPMGSIPAISSPTSPGAAALRAEILPERPDGEPAEGPQASSGLRSDLLHESLRQPSPALSAWGRLLAALDVPEPHAQALALAPVRHPAQQADQARHRGHRNG
jgi:hypothetical protein